METTACLLCGATDTRAFYEVPDLLLGLPGTFQLVRCTSCDLVYQNPRPTPAEIGAYYPDEYDSYTQPPWAHPNPVARAVQLYGLKKRWRFVERWAPARAGRRHILDVGCATGVFLASGSDSWSKVGVELSQSAAHYARERFGLTVYQGAIENVQIPAQRFDVITLWDVLEHIHNPLEALERLRNLLQPDGILVARVPNIDAWEAKLSGRYWAGLDQPRHLFVPGEATLTQLLRKAGFIELERQCLGGSAAMLALSWRFWLRQQIGRARWRQMAQAALDNLVVRVAALPMFWVVDKVFKKGALLTFAARATNI